MKKSRWSEINISASRRERKINTSKEVPAKFAPQRDFSRSSDKLF